MKQAVVLLIALICLGFGYIIGAKKSSQSGLVDYQESQFVVYNQQANYKLVALKNISEGKYSEAAGILKASLIVDESEMSNCGVKTSGCDPRFKEAFEEYMSKKTTYEKNSERK